MFDIGMTEMLVVGVLALVVVGPKELPKLLRTIGGLVRRARELTADFREGVESLAAEAEREMDPFHDLRQSEGIRPGMSPEEITDHILSNRERETRLGDENIAKDEGLHEETAEKKPQKAPAKKATVKKTPSKRAPAKPRASKKTKPKAGEAKK